MPDYLCNHCLFPATTEQAQQRYYMQGLWIILIIDISLESNSTYIFLYLAEQQIIAN